MKKALSLVLAVIMLLGCMSITAFAEDYNTFSYDADTNTVTINCVIPTVTVGGSVPNGELEFSPDTPEVDAIWVKVTSGEGIEFGSKKWVDFSAETAPVFEAGAEYGYAFMLSAEPEMAAPKVIVNGNNGVSVVYDAVNGYNGRFICIADFGILGTDGKFYGGDFVVTSGSTSITANVAPAAVDEPVVVPVGYTISIPAAVTMTGAGVQEIGTPTVENVKNATVATVISYTAIGTQLTLETDSEKTMTTSYCTNSAGTAPMPTTAINVYKNGAFVSPLTTLYVGVTESDWNNAAKNNPGTYKATMTFNFTSVETPCNVGLDGYVFRIGSISDTTVQVGVFFYENGTFNKDRSGIVTASRDENDTSITILIGDAEYKTGDVFHFNSSGSTIFKCTNVQSHTNLPAMNELTHKDFEAVIR